MTLRTQRRTIAGPAGSMEVVLDRPASPPLGVAFIGHPHPLYGGTLDNKVAATLARAFTSAGWIAVRPNFRGVGATEGTHDHGHGETDDFLWLIDHAADWSGGELGGALPRALAGFSFGSFVAAQAHERLRIRGDTPRLLVLVGAAAGKWAMPAVPAHTLVIHGEMDDTIPLADVFTWARPLELPVTVLPGADHFFHRRLSTLKRLVIAFVHQAPHGDAADPGD